MDLVCAPLDGAASACFSPPVLDLPGRKLCRSPPSSGGNLRCWCVCAEAGSLPSSGSSLTGCSEPLSTCGA